MADRQAGRTYYCTKCRSIDRTSTKGFQAQNLKSGQIKAAEFSMEMGTGIIRQPGSVCQLKAPKLSSIDNICI
jgi:hypothetical protein